MRTVIATYNTDLEHYILTTHQDILILVQEKEYRALKSIVQLHKPELLILDDTINGLRSIQDSFIELNMLSPQTKFLWLYSDKKLTAEKEDFLNSQKLWLVKKPILNHELSRIIYEIAGVGTIQKAPSIFAVWSPKSGDGATITTEALSFMLHSLKKNGGQIGVFDFNLKSPYLKLRYGFEDSIIIDDLVTFIAGGILNAEIVGEYARKIKDCLTFIGGIQHPELHGKYNATHLNTLLDLSKDIFTHVVIDAGSTLDNVGTLTALKNADVILAVMQPNYISKYSLKGILRLFPSFGINPNKVKLVINRYVPEISGSAEIITAGLNLSLAGTLPELGAEANLISKTSLFEDKSNKRVAAYNQAMREILKEGGLYTDEDKIKKAPMFTKLLSRR